MSEMKQIVVEDVLEMLQQGKTRKEIQNHYELNGVEAKILFSDPALKGKRTYKKRNFVVVSRNSIHENSAMEESGNMNSNVSMPVNDVQDQEGNVTIGSIGSTQESNLEELSDSSNRTWEN
jgi:hypothetical protein